MAAWNTITKRAIEACGGTYVVAEMLGVSRQAVEKWVRIPPRHVLRVEAESGVSRYELRPDIFGTGRQLDPLLRARREVAA